MTLRTLYLITILLCIAPVTTTEAKKQHKTFNCLNSKLSFINYRVCTLFEQKILGLFNDFQGHISHFSTTPFSAKKSLESTSFLVLPQHEQFYPEGLSVFAPFSL